MLFSPDGRYILTYAHDSAPDQGNELVLWNVATGDEMRRMNLPTHSVMSMAFSPDGDTVIAGLPDGTVRLWDIRTGKEKARFAGHIEQENSRYSIGVSPDGNTAISVSTPQVGESEIILWDIPTGEERYRMYEGGIIYANDLAISSDGRTALIALNGYNPALVSTYWMAIDVEHGQVRYRSTKTAEHIGDITVSPDDQAVLYAVGKRIILWDLVNDKLLRQFEGHTDRVTSVAFHPDGTTIVSGARDGTVRLWDVAGGQEIRHFTGHATHILNVGFRADGKAVLSRAHDGTVRQWRIDTPEAMIAWTCTNRHVPELTAGQRIHYGIPDDLVLCPVQSLVRQARHQARAGNPEAAMETYTQALDLNPDLDFDAETELKRIPATARWRQGDGLARHGDITGAIATFAAALALDPTLDFDAEARAVEVAVPMLIHQSETLARNGNIDAAMAHFAEVRMLLLDPDLEIEPQARAQELTALCWWGSLSGYADEAEVQDVCEQAVGLAPDHGAMRDSRGVHRALTGDVDGAIADFTAFVAWARENNVREAEAIIARREAWIAAREAGEHPFTEETRNALRNE
jgi:outer membrane protein assembly factor BamB